MPLKIKMSPESMRPVVVCDGCGEAIADASDGNYHWQAPVDPAPSRNFVFFMSISNLGIFYVNTVLGRTSGDSLAAPSFQPHM